MNKSISRTTKLKMSNLLLLVIPLIVGLIFSAFIVSVNTKATAGEFAYVNRDKTIYVRHRLEGRTVVVEHIDDCMVILSDSVSLEIHKDDRDKFEYAVHSDSIRITQTGGTKNRVFIYLPSGSHLVAKLSGVTIKGSLFDSQSEASYDVVLRNSKLFVSAAKLHTFFDRLNVAGSGTDELTIDESVHIRNLGIQNITNVSIAQGWEIGNLKTAFVGSTEMSKEGNHVSIKSE